MLKLPKPHPKYYTVSCSSSSSNEEKVVMPSKSLVRLVNDKSDEAISEFLATHFKDKGDCRIFYFHVLADKKNNCWQKPEVSLRDPESLVDSFVYKPGDIVRPQDLDLFTPNSVCHRCGGLTYFDMYTAKCDLPYVAPENRVGCRNCYKNDDSYIAGCMFKAYRGEKCVSSDPFIIKLPLIIYY